MKTGTTILIAVLLLGGYAGSLAAGPATAQQDPVAVPSPEENPDLLPDTMLELESALKKLRRSVRKPEQEAASLAHLQEIQRTSLICKELTPNMTADLPEAERAAFVKAYRREMLLLLQKTIACELAVLDGDTAKARALYKEMSAMEDSGHERFTPDG